MYYIKEKRHFGLATSIGQFDNLDEAVDAINELAVFVSEEKGTNEYYLVDDTDEILKTMNVND